MSYTLKGKIVKHLETKTGEGKKGAWASAKFVVEEVGAEYPQTGVFSLMKSGEYVNIANEFAKKNPVGSEVEVEFNLRANEYKGNYYGDLSVWKVTSLTPVASGADDEDDLPF